MKRALKEYRSAFLAIIGLVLLSVVVGGYIMVKQRLRLPTQDYYSINVEMPTAQAITPGQGQTVGVAGVSVGEIGDVTLRNGRALVRLDIRREKLPEVHADATVLTRPKTPLQDMSVELDPGSKSAPELRDGATLPIDRATPNVNTDEILAGLDGDTRPYLTGMLQGFSEGVGADRGVNLKRFLAATLPTLKSTRELTGALRSRRVELKRAVGALSRLTSRIGEQSDDVGGLVSSANGTFTAFANEDASLRAALAELPATLQSADRALSKARPLANELRPTLDGLKTALDRLPSALTDAGTFARRSNGPVTQLRGLSREGQPLARTLGRTLTALNPSLPDLTTASGVLNEVANELAYNPAGKEEGYLFWLNWFAHNTNSMLSTRDGNGGWWRGQLAVSCSNVDQLGLIVPLLKPLAAAGICPK